MNNKKTLTVADFFCGAGGFSEGFRQKGFDVIFALDNWKPAVETHDLNHPKCDCVQKNILELDTPEKIDKVVPDVDVLIGSPPCVSFSYSNKAGKADKSLGIQLIEAYLRIILWKKSKPNSPLKYWLLENVPNSGNYIKFKYTWKGLKLPGKGPDLKIPVRQELTSSDYGAPQNRIRFVCGNYPIPKKTHKGREVLIKDVFDSLGDPLKFNKVPEIIKDPANPFSLEAYKLTDHFYDTRIEKFEWERAKRLKIDHGFMGVMDFPERLNRTCRTITATRSSSTRESIIFGAEKKNDEYISFRLPTIREVSCFMGFPINYQFEGLNESVKYKLVGNAVCPPLSAALAGAIRKDMGLEEIDFIPLKPKKLASVDLNGTICERKIQKPKRLTSQYYRHIPHLKIESMRVELSNRDSDFDEEKFVWKSKLHHGSGKSAYSIIQKNASFKNLIKKIENFDEFDKKISNNFERMKSHFALQKAYCLLSEDSYSNPDEILEEIRRILDEVYPPTKYNKRRLKNDGLFPEIRKPEIPLRVVMGFYALNKVVDKLS
ncbi:DNA cytosine methyltransferase [Candidatus Peregrinibacteria bacterium]|nr:DNA cytosine methyltransferase [Candidatus Peregrinibacteria bacterium]